MSVHKVSIETVKSKNGTSNQKHHWIRQQCSRDPHNIRRKFMWIRPPFTSYLNYKIINKKCEICSFYFFPPKTIEIINTVFRISGIDGVLHFLQVSLSE